MNVNRQHYYFQMINKNGQALYQDNLLKNPQITVDEFLSMAAIFYTIDAISTTIVPEELQKKFGNQELDQLQKIQIETIVTDTFKLYCFNALTGTKFILVSNKNNQDGNIVLKQIYEIYSDYVQKDPAFITDQPIKNDKFTHEINKILQDV